MSGVAGTLGACRKDRVLVGRLRHHGKRHTVADDDHMDAPLGRRAERRVESAERDRERLVAAQNMPLPELVAGVAEGLQLSPDVGRQKRLRIWVGQADKHRHDITSGARAVS
jgi:hypothetical protein